MLTLTGLIVSSAPLLAQSAQPLQQSGILGPELFNQTLSRALIHYWSVLNTFCPDKEKYRQTSEGIKNIRY